MSVPNLQRLVFFVFTYSWKCVEAIETDDGAETISSSYLRKRLGFHDAVDPGIFSRDHFEEVNDFDENDGMEVKVRKSLLN